MALAVGDALAPPIPSISSAFTATFDPTAPSRHIFV
jgi:hypothetical protein